ncbi:hydroxyethylthiazole kinase [Vibrio fluvialis]|uniref:hydroxyethylthiazole kinase n=1 Tax=Vibrio fluvialis TaxID=676 RepID=UPI001EEB02EA|nr:hydroxyethylthiazole kinase [Vibrio fluvialis]ELV8592848.1 hydroxyethylthiazole kinase [Vibrio fluvialis]MCG6381665.1 hydroxyethylthiazole kinase [Vibrio fluvialis]
MNTLLIADTFRTLRATKPLVVNITNYVVMNNSANALLAAGASPIMAHSRQEMDELMQFAGALVINIGTLDEIWLARMEYAIEAANRNHKPVVLDPVGCGASRLRTDASRNLAAKADTLIIRANASEVMAMAGEAAQGQGVDARDSSHSAIAAAKALVNRYQANVVISGPQDFIVTDSHLCQLSNGDKLMPLVTGMGCSLSALTGACAAAGDLTGLTAAAIMGVAGELAARRAKGPGSLQMELLDALYQLDEATLLQLLRFEDVSEAMA